MNNATLDAATTNEQKSREDLLIPNPVTGIDYTASAFIIAMHTIALVAGPFTFSWPALAVCIFLHWVSGGLGITLGYHRLLTHRSFKTPKFMEYFLTLMAQLACQGGPISWITTHRLHHTYSDQPLDPHSPRAGFFWSHMGWCMVKNANIANPEVQQKVSPDLIRDKGMIFIEKTHILWTVLLAAGLYAWGGWSFVVWGIAVRLVAVYHCTWFVNSAAHIWGYQTYKSNDDSTNLWWVALLTYGEGWHNNHHAFQYSARHGLKWWEFDSTYLMIQVMEKLGLATAVKIPPARLLQEKAN